MEVDCMRSMNSYTLLASVNCSAELSQSRKMLRRWWTDGMLSSGPNFEFTIRRSDLKVPDNQFLHDLRTLPKLLAHSIPS